MNPKPQPFYIQKNNDLECESMNKYNLECAVKRKYPDIFHAEDFLKINSFPRSNIKWMTVHRRVYNQDRMNWNYEELPNRYYFYHDRLFAIRQLDCPIYPGEMAFMFIEVDSMPINALVNAMRIIINAHTPFLVSVVGKNTGTYKVVKIDDQPFKYIDRGAILRLVERPTLMTEEFVPYKRPEMMGEPNSDW